MLPDGRVLLTGGEYLVNKAGTALYFALTPKSAIYDPRADSWTMVDPLPAWHALGDSPGTLRADGLYMIGVKVSRQDAVFDPARLKWVPVTAPGKADENAEEGWTLLPDTSILTADVRRAPNSELFIPSANPTTGQWISAGSTGVDLKFTWPPGPESKPHRYKYKGQTYEYLPAGEIGPAILRPDGNVFATGALTKGATAGHTAIYHPGARLGQVGTWTPGPDFAPGDDAGDEFAALLPNGNVLVEANTNGADDNDTRAMRVERYLQTGMPAAPTVQRPGAAAAGPLAKSNPCAPFPVQTYHLYEYDGAGFPITGIIQTCGNSLALLPLPTGQILIGGLALYGSVSGNPAPDWAPAITQYPQTVSRGGVYTISGRQFTGLSQAAAYGDEFPTPTNYPLVRITNAATGHVAYGRTHDWSNAGVATGNLTVSTMFDVPDAIEPGPSLLEVVANGIPSVPVQVVVR